MDPFPGFHIIKPLESGIFGLTFLVEKDNQLYVIKTPQTTSGARKSLERETRASSLIPPDRQKNFVLPIEKLGSKGVVTRYVQGSSLSQLYDSQREFGYMELDKLLTDLLTGVSVFHSYGIAHRDIKLSNIIWNPSIPEATIIDFGLSTTKQSSKLRGSLKYISKELYYQAIDEKSHSLESLFRGDVYAVGICLYLLVNSKMPYSELPDSSSLIGYDFDTYSKSKGPYSNLNKIIDEMITEPRKADYFLEKWTCSAQIEKVPVV